MGAFRSQGRRLSAGVWGRRFVSWASVALSVGRTIGPGPNIWTAQIGTATVFGAR